MSLEEKWLLKYHAARERQGRRRVGYRRLDRHSRRATSPASASQYRFPPAPGLRLPNPDTPFTRSPSTNIAGQVRAHAGTTIGHDNAQPRPIERSEQRWFVGAHANVGGGYADRSAGAAPLRWLMKKAEWRGWRSALKSIWTATTSARRSRTPTGVHVWRLSHHFPMGIPINHRSGAGSPTTTAPYERQRDHRRQRLQALARRPDLPTAEPGGMGEAQTRGSRPVRDVGPRRRSQRIRA